MPPTRPPLRVLATLPRRPARRKADSEAAARDIAHANGFLNGTTTSIVDVNIPPGNGLHRGLTGYIEVEISNKRPSVFAGDHGRHLTGTSALARWRGTVLALAATSPSSRSTRRAATLSRSPAPERGVHTVTSRSNSNCTGWRLGLRRRRHASPSSILTPWAARATSSGKGPEQHRGSTAAAPSLVIGHMGTTCHR